MNRLEIKQYMHECQNLDLFDLDMELMTSVGPVHKQQETSSRYCVANDQCLRGPAKIAGPGPIGLNGPLPVLGPAGPAV
jgi:hypothetical protein